LEKISSDPLDILWQVGRPLNQVQTRYSSGGGEGAVDFAAKVAFSRADFEDLRGRVLMKLMQDPPGVSEVEVDPPQIPATPNGTRIRGIQGIQNLGNNDALLHN
jgi:hypothetical protein